ncbi:hypothetical protein BGZ79_005079, partial [Entomortierella chlamydospora]
TPQEDLQMSIEELGMAKDELVFQRDNDSKHAVKAIHAYLPSIGTTETDGALPQSFDLNTIEHM